jgi:hypothetical protein
MEKKVFLQFYLFANMDLFAVTGSESLERENDEEKVNKSKEDSIVIDKFVDY